MSDNNDTVAGYTKVLANVNGSGVNPSDDTAVLDLIRKKLVLALEKSENAREIVAVAGELMDRIEGKPMQRQQSLIAVADASKTPYASILEQIDGRSSGLPEIEG